jgi:diguanylate cyclase (GGDEF)-like protein
MPWRKGPLEDARRFLRSPHDYVNTASGASRAFDYAAAGVGAALAGAADYATGANVHVLALYFVPLAFAGWRLGRRGAAIASLIATLAWLVVLYAHGARHEPYVWIVNFVTQGVGYVLFSLLVAVLGQALRKEQLLRRIDSLTGLRNRHGFVDEATVTLALCKRHRRPVALAFIDLDNFKDVNDAMGHTRGDAVLRQFGTMLGSSLRASDIAARIGGDEFVVFLPETTGESAIALLERIRGTLETDADFRNAGITASVGIVVDEHAASDIDALLRRADAQMYSVKRDGKNRVGLHDLGACRVDPVEHAGARPGTGEPASAAGSNAWPPLRTA